MPRSRPSPSDFALLGVAAGAEASHVRSAFLQAVKAARPDRGGDPQRYRELIAAYRRLSTPAEHLDLDVRVELKLSPAEAAAGGSQLVHLPTGKAVRVSVPPGVATGQTLRLRRQGLNAPGRWGDVYLSVAVAEAAAPSPAFDRSPNATVLLRRFTASWAA